MVGKRGEIYGALTFVAAYYMIWSMIFQMYFSSHESYYVDPSPFASLQREIIGTNFTVTCRQIIGHKQTKADTKIVV